MSEIFIRPATPADARALRKIYAPYVTDTAITFEYTVPGEAAFAERIRATLAKYPYLVAERDGAIVGYAYASAFHPRAAYQWAAEASVYVAQHARGTGVGHALYQALEDDLRRANIINLNACIASTESESIHLTNASRRFHEKMGYRLVGKFSQCGYKFGTWYDMIWMEKMLAEHPDVPAPVILFPNLPEKNAEQ